MITVKVQQPTTGKRGRVGEIPYKYQFMSPDSTGYSVSVTKFATELLEKYRWNLLDNYVINRGFKADDNKDILTTKVLASLPRY